MNNTQLQDYWEKEYENTATQFDVEQPDRWIAELEEKGKIQGNILDAGCGPGRTSLYLAKLGYNVVGTDIAANAIERAQAKAAKEKIKVEFLQADMTKFDAYQDYFATVIDIGCFHSLPGDKERQAYAQVLAKACSPEAHIYLRAFSERNLHNKPQSSAVPGNSEENHSFATIQKPKGVPAIKEEEIRATFSLANGWQIKDLQEKQIELLVGNKQRKLGYCWFAVIEKA